MQTTLHGFGTGEGANPVGRLTQGRDGLFYGTTSQTTDVDGDGDGGGTVFSMTPDGVLTTLHVFTGDDGSSPMAALVQGSDGNFYGTTSYGGLHDDGTVFTITPGGTLTTLHHFNNALAEGSYPLGALVEGATACSTAPRGRAAAGRRRPAPCLP